MLDEREWNNIEHYPKPKKSDSEMYSLMKSKIVFPEIAKKRFIGHTVITQLTIDTSGHITAISLLSEPVPIFDTSAIKTLKTTDGLWESGYAGSKKKPYDIKIPISFYSTYRNDQVYFTVSMFYNFDSIIVDSTNTFPAFLHAYRMVPNLLKEDTKEFYYPFSNYHLEDEWQYDIQRSYGKIEFGVEIDTNGKATSYQVMTSFSPLIDSEALTQLRRFDWIPAHKNGEKIPSFKYFYVIVGNYVTLNNWERKSYRSYDFCFTPMARKDFLEAEKLYNEGQYKYALELFKQVANFYDFDPEVFYDKALTEAQLNMFEEACADFQKCYDLAEDFGYPLGLQKSQIEDIVNNKCK